MSKIDDGGQAFPRPFQGKMGMTLLDWFAAHATEKDYFPYIREEVAKDEFETHSIEKARYLYAKAMIKTKRALE